MRGTWWEAHDERHMMRGTWWEVHDERHMMRGTWWGANDERHMMRGKWLEAHDERHMMRGTWWEAHVTHRVHDGNFRSARDIKFLNYFSKYDFFAIWDLLPFLPEFFKLDQAFITCNIILEFISHALSYCFQLIK